jgi:hypothetical protein
VRAWKTELCNSIIHTAFLNPCAAFAPTSILKKNKAVAFRKTPPLFRNAPFKQTFPALIAINLGVSDNSVYLLTSRTQDTSLLAGTNLAVRPTDLGP